MIEQRQSILADDNKRIYTVLPDWEALRDKTVLITGATGMLAACVVRFLVYLNKVDNLNINILILARNKQRVIDTFGETANEFTCFYQDVCEPLNYQSHIDFVIHAASSASPYHIKNDPVGIIKANVQGTSNLLELVKEMNVSNFLFLSTREVYGEVSGVEYIEETDFGHFDPLDARSCYPESKRLAETMLQSYAVQYGLTFNSVRIAHSYGPGMFLNDGRVMSDLLGDVVNDKPIVLKSDGSALRSFCYVTDAVSALLLVMLKGERNTAYNIANENDEVSILQLSKLLTKLSGNQHSVVHEIASDNAYCQYQRTKLSTSKLEALQWRPNIALSDGLQKTISYYR
ncbi:NAD-dependent epimerase/dehydratase family protein [Vibrio rotiferianus]|uniref:NAD-dependent epimerase/dehydratase family protein n=1 Tax=Vibrio rotiferianus TaxID=190895 RepID=UPI00406AAB98